MLYSSMRSISSTTVRLLRGTTRLMTCTTPLVTKLSGSMMTASAFSVTRPMLSIEPLVLMGRPSMVGTEMPPPPMSMVL